MARSASAPSLCYEKFYGIISSISENDTELNWRPHIRLSSVVWAGFEINARGSQRCMSKLVLEIADWYATIQAPDGKAMSEHMRMNTMPVLARLILALDFLQASSGGNAIEDILDLPGSDVAVTVAREQPALSAASELL